MLTPQIADKGVTRHILKAFGLHASHRLGQNFLISPAVVRAVVEAAVYFLDAFLCGLACLLWHVTCSESVLSQLQAVGDGRVEQRLAVGVADEEVYFVNTLAIHVVCGISSATTYAYNFYYGGCRRRSTHIYQVVANLWHDCMYCFCVY